jgi:hypothetical protein
MAIKFGDTLENQNSDYPIVDASANNVKGFLNVASLSEANLQAIPAAKRSSSALVVDAAAGIIYVYTGSDLENGNWDDTANWAVQTGSNTLDADGDVVLDDGTPAVSLSGTNTYTYAIDALNAVLGQLVPTAPKTFSQQQTDFNFDWDDIVSNNGVARILGGAAVPNFSHATTPADYAVVNLTIDGAPNTKTFTVSPTNDLELTELSWYVGNNDGNKATLAADSTTVVSVTGTSPAAVYSIDKAIGNFPTTDPGAGFYTGITSVTVTADLNFSDGLVDFTLEGGATTKRSNAVFKYADASPSASIGAYTYQSHTVAAGVSASGFTYVGSGTVVNLSITADNLFDPTKAIYGATTNSNTYNAAVTAGAGTKFAAFSSRTYQVFYSTSNLDTDTPTSATAVAQSSIIAANALGVVAIDQDTLPEATAKSIWGNSLSTEVSLTGLPTTDILAADSTAVAAQTYALLEDAVPNGLGNAGTRIGMDENNAYDISTAPNEYPSYQLSEWRVYDPVNMHGTSAPIRAIYDAITSPLSGTWRVQFDNTDYSQYELHDSYLPDLADNNSRTNLTYQWVFYRFPLGNIDGGVSLIKLRYKGDLSNGGKILLRIHDEGEANSLYNSMPLANNGWGDPGISAAISGGGGLAAASALNYASTSEQVIQLTSSTARWANASDGYLYVAVKLASGDYVEKLRPELN